MPTFFCNPSLSNMAWDTYFALSTSNLSLVPNSNTSSLLFLHLFPGLPYLLLFFLVYKVYHNGLTTSLRLVPFLFPVFVI